MSFLELILRNVLNRKVRSVLTGIAVAIAIMTVFALGVLTYSLRETAVSILNTGKADFTVGQKGVSDVIYSTMDESELGQLGAYQGVDSAIGVLIAISSVDQQHPFFLELGIQPEHLSEFGVQVVAGRPFTTNATNEMMLGYRAAQDFHKSVGDTFTIDKHLVHGRGHVFHRPGIRRLCFDAAARAAAVLRTQARNRLAGLRACETGHDNRPAPDSD